MRMSALSQATGIHIETIRYYEKEGLLPAPDRSESGYRVFRAEHVERLAFIRHCRDLDISLAEVKRLLDFIALPEADCGDIDRLIDTQLAKVKARLVSMRALEQQLSSLKGRCGANHTVSECGILHELVAAAHKEACACQP